MIDSVDEIVATTPQEGRKQELDRFLTFLTEWRYNQSVKDVRKDVSGTPLSPTFQGQAPSAPNVDQLAELCQYCSPIISQLKSRNDPHSKNEERAVNLPKGPRNINLLTSI